jgi:hypothetical protein
LRFAVGEAWGQGTQKKRKHGSHYQATAHEEVIVDAGGEGERECVRGMNYDDIVLITSVKHEDKVFIVNFLLEGHGHSGEILMSVNKLQVNQPCICDPNPTELAWAGMKRCVRSHSKIGKCV